jgi:hypothetical protein
MVDIIKFRYNCATVKVSVISIDTVIDDEYPEIYVLGCVLKPEVPIYVCEFGAYLARGITIHTETTTITTGHVKKL